MHHGTPSFLDLRLYARRFEMPLEELGFVKTLAAVKLIYAADPLLQNMTKIVCLR